MAEETKAAVAADEAFASKVKEEAQIISDDAQKDLEEALPALEAAERSLQALNKGDIGEVKALKTPPSGVITVIETICIIKGIAPKKVFGLIRLCSVTFNFCSSVSFKVAPSKKKNKNYY